MAKNARSAQSRPGDDRIFVIVRGTEGTVPVFDNGEMRRIPCGVETEITAGERDYLKRATLAFKEV